MNMRLAMGLGGVMLSSLFFGACALFGGGDKEGPLRGSKIPDWHLNPRELLQDKYGDDVGFFFGTGQATKEVGALAKDAADVRALTEVGRQVSTQVKSKIQDYMAQSGASGDNPGVLEFTEVVSRLITETELTGARIDKRAVSDDGRTYFSMAIYPLEEAQALISQLVNKGKEELTSSYKGNENALFNEFKARQAFGQLDGKNIQLESPSHAGP